MKKTLLLLTIVLFSTASVFAQGGTTGPLTWNISGNTLTISGNGAMPNYIYESSITTAPWSAYLNSINTVIVENGVTTIGNYAFYAYSGFNNLTSITIGNTVTTIGNRAFGRIGAIEITIPESVAYIAYGAFVNCTNLNTVYFNAVECETEYNSNAAIFEGCTALSTVIIGNNVTKIPYYAFYYAIGLNSVTIGSSVTNIKYSAFRGCTNLTSITIPESVTSIDNYAFSDCTNLTTLNFNATNCTSANGAWTNLNNVIIGNNVKTIPANIFSYCYITSITIPEGVTTIGNQAFYGCNNLTALNFNATNCTSTNVGWTKLNNVIIGNNVEIIPSNIFSGCANLTSITIPNNVTTIGNQAFKNCIGLSSIILPNGVTNIGNSAFSSCTNLTALNFNATNCTSANAGWTNLNNVIIGNNVKIVPSNIFSGCTNLTSITIPNNVTVIGDSAFRNCSSLNAVKIPLAVTSIGNDAFSGSNSLSEVTVLWNTPLAIAENVWNNAPVGNCILYVPTGTVNSYRIANVWKNFGAIFSGPTTGDFIITEYGLLWQYNGSGGSVIIPNNVTAIANNVFANRPDITSITIPNSVTTIGDNAFSGCSGLTSMTIPNSVTLLGYNIFQGCSAITELTLPFVGTSATATGSNALLGVLFGISTTTFTEDFETGNGTSLSGWTIVNGTQTNKWYIGTGIANGGTKSCYISNNASSFRYLAYDGITGGCSSKVHFYRDIEVVSTTTEPAVISFDWTALGYSSYGYQRDYLAVYLVATSVTPSAGNLPQGTALATLNLNSVWQHHNITLPAMSGTRRLVFSWNNDCNAGSTYGSPAAVDNIIITNVMSSGYQAVTQYGSSSSSSTFHIPSSLKKITVTGSNNLGYGAFSNCNMLKEIILPTSITTIGNYAFQNCTALDTVKVQWATPLPFSINSNVFSGVTCSNVTLKVPTGKASLYRNANVWKEFKIPVEQSELSCSNPSAYGAANPLIWSICDSTLIINGSKEIPDYTSNSAPWYAHRNSIKNVELDATITTIGNYAFTGCTNLASITIPSSVSTIGSYAFNGCSKLSNVDIQTKTDELEPGYNYTAGVKTINDGAFSGCTNLSSIIIPKTVTTLTVTTFNGSSFTAINVDPDNSTYASEEGVLYNQNKTNLICYPPKKTENTFVIPNSVTNIGANAFSACSNLKSVTISNSVTNISSPAFYNCAGLTVVNYNATNCTTMGSSSNLAFQNCNAFTTLNIGSNVTRIPAYAFFDCNKITSSLDIPNSVTNIGTYAFSGCSKIPSVKLSNNITTVNDYTFQNCTSLKTVFIPDHVTTISNTAFSGCSNIEEVTIPRIFSQLILSTLKKLTIGAECASIPVKTFSTCTNLVELTLPFIGTTPTAPNSLVSLFNSSVPATLKKLTLVRSDNNIQIADNALSGLSHLTEVTFSSNVRGLGEKALYGCNGLEHIYSHWANPPAAYNNSTFEGVNKYACTVHVPMGSKEKYATASGWKEFYDIQEEAAVMIVARPVPLYGGIIDGTLQYNYDQTAKLTATGNMGYDFQCWIEDDAAVCTQREYSFVVEGPRVLYAVFTPRENENSVTVTTSPTEAVIVWNGEAGASSYTIILYLDAARTQEYARFEFDEFGNPRAVISCTIPKLTPNTPYYYTITSYDKDDYKLNIYNGNFTATAGIPELPITNHELRVYPNPTTGELTITNYELGITNIDIFDIYGKKLSSNHLIPSSSNHQINISQLSAGIYFLKIGNKTVKVVKQ